MPAIFARNFSTSAGGNWTSYSTWEENSGKDCGVDDCYIPSSSDVVEINGDVIVNSDTTIFGLMVNSGATLANHSSYSRTLTVTGGILNDGTIQTNPAGHLLSLEVDGGINNQGTWSPYRTTLLGNMEVFNTTTLGGTYFDCDENILTVNSPNVVTISGDLLNSTHTFNGTGIVHLGGKTQGTIIGNIPELHISGAADSFIHASMSVPKVIFEADSFIVSTDTVTINGDVEIAADTIVQNNSSYSRTLAVNGNIVNNGTLRSNPAGSSLSVKVAGDIENNGTWSPYWTRVVWDAVASVDYYEFALTQDPENWPAPTTTNHTYYDVSGLLGDSYYWKVRAKLTDDSYTDWSSVKTIN